MRAPVKNLKMMSLNTDLLEYLKEKTENAFQKVSDIETLQYPITRSQIECTVDFVLTQATIINPGDS